MSSILMRASNSCSPSRLFCMGPKVLPAHCTEPTSWGRCFSCSRRMRFSTPPALDRADTCGEEQRALSLCVCTHMCVFMCMYTHTHALTSVCVCNGEWGLGKTINKNGWKAKLHLSFSPQRKATPNLLCVHTFPRKELLAVSFSMSVFRDYRKGGHSKC